jgi:anti-sigma B factor antagonist
MLSTQPDKYRAVTFAARGFGARVRVKNKALGGVRGIVENRLGSTLTLSTDVRLDATSAPQLSEKIEQIAQTNKGIELLVIDMAKTIYMSSLGLRALLQGLKTMKKAGGNLSIQNITPQIRPVFEMTGLMDLMIRDEKLVIVRTSDVRASATLSLAGKLTDETVDQLTAEINNIADKYADVYLDCANLKFIDNDGFRTLRAARDLVSKNKGGVLMLVNFPESMKRLLAVEKLEELLYPPPLSVKIERDKAVFSLTGRVEDLTAPALRKHLERILESNKVKEIHFYLGNLIAVSKQVIITFDELRENMLKNGVVVKLTSINPDAAG